MLSEEITTCLKKQTIPPRILLNRFRILDEVPSHASLDPTYLPLFYHLGKLYPKDSVLEFGFGIGLTSGCYLMGNNNISDMLCFQQKGSEYFSPRLGKGNIKLVTPRFFNPDIYHGEIYDEEFEKKLKSRKWGIAFFNEYGLTYDKMIERLTLIWDNLDGLLVMDFVSSNQTSKKAYYDFCKVKQRKPAVIMNRYGIGLIDKE